MPRNLHVYVPDEFEDFGAAGEHPVRYVAEIFSWGSESRPTVIILEAVAHVTYKNSDEVQKLNYLPQLLKYPASLRAKEQEILEDYRKPNDYDEREPA